MSIDIDIREIDILKRDAVLLETMLQRTKPFDCYIKDLLKSSK